MKIETLIAAGKAAFGEHWVTPMSEALGVSDRTVRHWVSGKYNIPTLISSDIQIILKNRISLINEAIEMTKETFLMNPFTGSIDTKENWLCEMPTWETNSDGMTAKEQFDSLIEVAKNENGDWEEI